MSSRRLPSKRPHPDEATNSGGSGSGSRSSNATQPAGANDWDRASPGALWGSVPIDVRPHAAMNVPFGTALFLAAREIQANVAPDSQKFAYEEFVKGVLSQMRSKWCRFGGGVATFADELPSFPVQRGTALQATFTSFPKFLAAWTQAHLANLPGCAANRLTVTNVGLDPSKAWFVPFPVLEEVFPVERILRLVPREPEMRPPSSREGAPPSSVFSSVVAPELQKALDIVRPTVLEVYVPARTRNEQNVVRLARFVYLANEQGAKALGIVTRNPSVVLDVSVPRLASSSSSSAPVSSSGHRLGSGGEDALVPEPVFRGTFFGIVGQERRNGNLDYVPNVILPRAFPMPNLQVLRCRNVHFQGDALNRILQGAQNTLAVFSVLDCVLQSQTNEASMAEIARLLAAAPRLAVVEIGSISDTYDTNNADVEEDLWLMLKIIDAYSRGFFRGLKHLRYTLAWEEDDPAQIDAADVATLHQAFTSKLQSLDSSPKNLTITLAHYSGSSDLCDPDALELLEELVEFLAERGITLNLAGFIPNDHSSNYANVSLPYSDPPYDPRNLAGIDAICAAQLGAVVHG